MAEKKSIATLEAEWLTLQKSVDLIVQNRWDAFRPIWNQFEYFHRPIHPKILPLYSVLAEYEHQRTHCGETNIRPYITDLLMSPRDVWSMFCERITWMNREYKKDQDAEAERNLTEKFVKAQQDHYKLTHTAEEWELYQERT